MRRNTPARLTMLTGSLMLVGPGIFLTFGRSRCELEADAKVEVTLETDYEEVRTRLVRQDPTEALFKECDFELLSSETVARDIDLSSDNNPILNAIRRESRSTIKCLRRLEVCADSIDDSLDHVVLRQRSLISPRGTRINTDLDSQEDILNAYETDVKITPSETGCTLEINMHVDASKRLSYIERWFADEVVRSKVQEACERQAELLVKHLKLKATRSELALQTAASNPAN